MKQLNTDVVIVGAGLVGLALASALAQRGKTVTLIEKRVLNSDFKAPPVFEQRGIVLSEISCQILSSLGIQLEHAEVIKQVHVSEQGQFAKVRFDADKVGLPQLARVLKAFELVRALYDHVMTLESVHLYSGATIQSVNEDDAVLDFSIEDSSYQVNSDIIIASDGAQSEVLKQLGIEQIIKTFNQTALICNLTLSGKHQSIAYERFMADGPLAFLPVSQQEVAMVWCMSAERAQALQQLEPNDLFERIHDAFGYRMGRFLSASKRHTHELKATHATVQQKGKVLVMGNAAHSLHPVAGQGFNLSLRDVMACADHLTQQDNQTIEARMARYIAERQSGQDNMSMISEILPLAFTERYRAFAPLRSLALLLCDRVPPLNKRLTHTFLGLTDYEQSA